MKKIVSEFEYRHQTYRLEATFKVIESLDTLPTLVLQKVDFGPKKESEVSQFDLINRKLEHLVDLHMKDWVQRQK